MTDLKAVNDHPAAVVQRSAKAYADLGVNLDDNGWLAASFRGRAEHYTQAADELRQYETEHDVTFTALDNDTLRTLREVYNEAPSSEYTQDDLNAVLRGLVNDLLGLDDE